MSVTTTVKKVMQGIMIAVGGVVMVDQLLPSAETANVTAVCTKNDGHHVSFGDVVFAVPKDQQNAFNFVAGQKYQMEVSSEVGHEPRVKTAKLLK